ncbi:phosphoribosylamine--glycine ligase [Candidatus Peregrinibacteria bacterium CG22_combo_CG10-13_8_21_14_all_44_10]|nr:MAG: phosphoribosylamine--glycine ligase [Candidatus Peregrinibacteria bacterium CG2_30_44_17]PIP66019.1 MAG: phosphoribosylamine--glycine ligase [Candidatus Peregrinibacteria bacterium CG22_combo_CG10-13_8_21_14_all_44_10]PIX79319.1 MAG: phosphoribosylamine--glycine ligase [Candidatus Peregrinibacteria bacterium CG_4_10_14_3_um_filter_44_21]PJB88810.1 MAG: phosphoribosylamine--glycine ligase [Candidatus Peregrinibacteria bacterium CG_4_9_14_0_8_um_filter_44_15]
MKKTKFLFVSISGLIGDIAWHVKKEGNSVKYYIDEKSERQIGNGFVTKTNNWEAEVDWADVIVFDDVLGQGQKAKDLRARGKLVVGGTPYTDKLEDSRAFGQEQMKKHKISILPYKDFSYFDDGIEYIKNNPGKYVLKPSGEAQNIKRLLFVGQEDDGSDVIRILAAYRKTWSEEVKEYQLQKKVSSGVEVAVGAFFNGNEFIYPININFEHKKLFPGDLGVATGEMGTSMFWGGPNKLFNMTLKKLEPTLKEEGYVGYIDINCIVNGTGVYPLEFTSRFGYPTISIQQDSMITPIGEFLYKLAAGEKFEIKVKKGFHIGARVVTPPFPYKDKKTFDSFSKDAVIIFKKNNLEGIHIEDVKIDKGEWLLTGHSGIALIVAGTGMTMKQAQQQMYQRINNIIIPNMYYRKDIGDRWFEDSDKLHSWGYLREA